MSADWGPLDRLVARADELAVTMGARARMQTSVSQERALLRLFGVTGLDASGRPLAGATVDRWLARDPRGLGGGIALPFAMGLLEYDLDPQQLALDVASGSVDLGLEANLLREPDRRAVAEAEAQRLARAAIDRIDADRTARLEIIGLLGDAAPPWIGAALSETELAGAILEMTELVNAGVDVLRVEVPVGRELATQMQRAGQEVPEWRAGERSRKTGRPTTEPTPTGSQRALAELRRVADHLAAQRRAYVRLATSAPALWSPEDAVVAAFERIDLVEADPMAEIVATGVDPDRALADHSFADRIHRRAGTIVSIGAGSLVVAPDLRAGVPAGPATRSGRALGLQLLAVALARGEGLPDAQLTVAALPSWIVDEPAAGARSIAEVAVRRALYPDLALAFDEPEGPPDRVASWPQALAAVLVDAGDATLIMRRPGRRASVVREARAATRIAAEVASARLHSGLAGIALEHARGIVAEAMATLDLLGEHGWLIIAGDAPEIASTRALGGDAVADRTETFDPFESALGVRSR